MNFKDFKMYMPLYPEITLLRINSKETLGKCAKVLQGYLLEYQRK